MTDTLAATLQQALGDALRVDRELGGGGMSRVFVAHDLGLDRDVVVKVLSSDATAGVSAERFRREIQLIARLQHPHIVSILSFGDANGTLYYVMPFVRGETLRARLARHGRMPVPDAVRLLREVLDALTFAHDQGVVHRDIKPENVLLKADHAVVADFGIAKALREAGTLTSAGFAIGTPAFMAPEQAMADPATDHRADLYAVGVLAYEMLAGAPPFAGTPQQVVTAHLTTAAPDARSARPDVPDVLAELIARALAKDPTERPRDARAMLAVLDAVTTPARMPARSPASVPTGSDAARGSVAAAPASSSASAPAAPRRRATLAIAGVVAVAALGIVGVLGSRGRASAAIVAPGADHIAVMPLSAVSDTSLTRLGQDLVVTLSANLDGVGSVSTVDAVTLLLRTRSLPSPLPLRDAQELARELGARGVLTGTLIREGDQVRAAVTLHPLDGDAPIARASALGAPREIAALTDSLTWAVLRQVWQRGTPPSPVLSGLTTASFDALRDFLDGERAFRALDVDRALAAYRRAFERDTMFAQAYLRHDYVTSWHLLSPDPSVRGRLLALRDRLPERERAWMEAREFAAPVPERVGRWRTLAAQYPDYPPVLMSLADAIIHSGPVYGIALDEATPLLDRLVQLVPDHADTHFHRAMVAVLGGSTADAVPMLDIAARTAAPPWARTLAVSASINRMALGTGKPPSDDSLDAMGREVAASVVSGAPGSTFFSGFIGMPGPGAAFRLATVATLRSRGIYSGVTDVAASIGEGHLHAGRGDWAGAEPPLRRLETEARMPPALRIASARVAAIGAFVDAVPVATADAALRRVRALPGIADAIADRAELAWLDGLVGVTAGDSVRVWRAVTQLLADTLTAGRLVRGVRASLVGLWQARTDLAAADVALQAVSDSAMVAGGFLLPVEAVNRMVIGRALRARGVPGDAERYLMWTDAGVNADRSAATSATLGTLTEYERGIALDEAGRRDAAILHLRRFVERYDMPPPAHEALVADARERLARLETTDAGAPRRSVPRK